MLHVASVLLPMITALAQVGPADQILAKLDPSLQDYSWLVGTWTNEQRNYLAEDGLGGYLSLNSAVRISPAEDGKALLITYSLEGSIAALAAVYATVTERVTVDPQTKNILGSVVIRDRHPQATAPDERAGEGKSEYTLAPAADNVWEGQSKGTHRGSPTHYNIKIKRENDETMFVSITNRSDRNPAGQPGYFVRLKRTRTTVR